MTKKEILALQSILSEPKPIVIVSHKNPDGDAIGSSLALANYLRQKNHDVTVIMPNDFPEFLKWLPGSSSVLFYDKQQSVCDEKIEDAKVIFTLDFNALSRV